MSREHPETLEEVRQWFTERDLPFRWRTEPNVDKRPAILRPTGTKVMPLGGIQIGIVVPDVHLGVGNDVFRAKGLASGTKDRLEKFLLEVGSLRDAVGRAKFRVIQLGDWYDLFRAPAVTLQGQIDAIENQYQTICDRSRTLPMLHAIGNHDAALYRNPTVTKSRYGLIQYLGSNHMVGFHGVNSCTLETIEAQNMRETVALNIVDIVALAPILGELATFAQMVEDDSFEEPWTKGNTGGDLPWERASGVPPDGWDAPFVARNNAATLVRSTRGIEYLTDEPVEIAFVGHTHRPGISAEHVTATRHVVLVDVGSWTYGRAEIGIVAPDGVGIAEIPVA
jgi:hypothetical protein